MWYLAFQNFPLDNYYQIIIYRCADIRGAFEV